MLLIVYSCSLGGDQCVVVPGGHLGRWQRATALRLPDVRPEAPEGTLCLRYLSCTLTQLVHEAPPSTHCFTQRTGPSAQDHLGGESGGGACSAVQWG